MRLPAASIERLVMRASRTAVRRRLTAHGLTVMSIVMQFWLASIARADCIASVFSDLLKQADVVVVTDIDSVSKDQTSVKIREIISVRQSRSYPSVALGSLIAIASDSDDSCGVRWIPPNSGQAGIFFLRWISKPKYVGEKHGWAIVGANREGEMPLNGETVFVARELVRTPE